MFFKKGDRIVIACYIGSLYAEHIEIFGSSRGYHFIIIYHQNFIAFQIRNSSHFLIIFVVAITFFYIYQTLLEKSIINVFGGADGRLTDRTLIFIIYLSVGLCDLERV